MLSTEEEDSPSGNLMPNSFDYLDDHLLLPHTFNLVQPSLEKNILKTILRSFDLAVKFPPIDFLSFFTKTLDENGFDPILTEQILTVLTHQMHFSDQLKKFFISYSATNIKRSGFQRFLIKNFSIFSVYPENYAENEDAKLVCHFLLRRFPAKIIRFQSFYKILKVADLITVLGNSIELLAKVDYKKDFLESWLEIGKGLIHLDNLKPRGFSEFLELSHESYKPMIKMGYLMSVSQPTYKLLHDTLLPILQANFHNESQMAIFYDFFCEIKFSPELALDWIPDVLFLLANNEQNFHLIKMLDRLLRIGRGKDKVECGRYVQSPPGQ